MAASCGVIESTASIFADRSSTNSTPPSWLILANISAITFSPRAFPSAEGRLPESLHFAESDVILGVVRARSVHKIGYGRNWDWAAA
jgi:hypothetical protein